MGQVHCKSKHAVQRHILIVAIFVGAVALLVACSNATPQNTVKPTPLPAPTLTLGKSSPVSSALLSPTDLTFNSTYPVAGWQRCDDYSVEKSLERYRAAYQVTSSAAAIWEYGSECSSANQTARVDEYAWLLKSDSAGAELNDALLENSYFDHVTLPPGKKVRQFERNSVVVRTLPMESNNSKPQYAAEIIGQTGSTVALIRITTETELTDENYLELAQLCLDRLQASQGGK